MAQQEKVKSIVNKPTDWTCEVRFLLTQNLMSVAWMQTKGNSSPYQMQGPTGWPDLDRFPVP